MTPEEKLESLLKYVGENDRVCPMPQRWNELWEMLPGRERKGGGWVPSLPLILGAWYMVPALPKILRLQEHIEWAREHGALDRIDEFLRGLPEEEWAHLGEF